MHERRASWLKRAHEKVRAMDMLELIDKIKATARAKRGIELQTEVQIVGELA